MNEMIYNALSSYYHALSVKGYMSNSHVQKLLLLIFYRDFVFNDFRKNITKDDYRQIELALNCLYGTTCLIPYPDYLSSGSLHLGDVTELATRVSNLEDTNVVKTIDSEDGVVVGTDVAILEEVEDFISSFTVTPSSVNDGESSIIHFDAVMTVNASIQIEKTVNGSSEVIYGPVTGTHIIYDYTLSNPTAGNITFTLRASYNDAVSVKSRTVEVHVNPITISSFTINPSRMYVHDETTIVFNGNTNRSGDLSILSYDGTVLYTAQNTNHIHYEYTLTPSSLGTLTFTLQARHGASSLDSSQASIQVLQTTFPTMYFGNADAEITSGSAVQSLSSTKTNNADGTYDRAYYYIAVHSSKTLKSIINRGVESVIDNFILKNDALMLNIQGTPQTYKLYECDINSYADAGDMDTYLLTITIE